jgi:two-component system chemotaxis response regulator CheB
MPETAFGPARRCELIVFAASAGGLPALRQVLGALPNDFDVAMAIVQHRTVSHPNLLPQILGRLKPRLRVKQAEDGDQLRPGTIYVAPPDFHLILGPNRTLELHDGRRIKFLRSSANPLLESAARALDGRVIAVVLTGTGSDAADGVQTVKRLGGIVIAQDPSHAQHPGMPAAAIETGVVNFVLPLEEIAPMLVRLAGPNGKPAPADRVSAVPTK